MSKINLLSSKIYNRIAAGEVVDRPYSVIKELVENSLDAGATSIEIQIINGGMTSIEVSDNGCGMEKEDLPKAILPHATSKISKLKDLDTIETLGFRGEALPSIASVSKLTIKSKTENSSLGAMIYCEGDEVSQVQDCAMANGTIVTVNNLFFNTPAREKFLRSERSEEGEITATVSRFILSRPNVSFKYVADGETIYQSFGDGFESAMVCIYGAGPINDYHFISASKNGATIEGYISKNYYTKGNRSHQNFFINGRYVENSTISTALNNAYKPYLMKHRYPLCVLKITVPSESIDVNVHPNKIDVRFANGSVIYSAINSIVSKVLDGSLEAYNIVKDTKQEPIKLSNDREYEVYKKYGHKPTDPYYFNAKPLNFEPIGLADYPEEKTKSPKEEFVATKEDIFAENKAYLEKLEQERNFASSQDVVQPVQMEVVEKRDLKFVAQVLNSFLVLEDGKDLFLIDQHAAHERIIFDKLNEIIETEDIYFQHLLVPYVLDLSNEEREFVANNKGIFMIMGIDFEEFGTNSYKLSYLLVIIADMNLDEFFKNLFADLNEFKDFTRREIFLEKLAKTACKTAVKAGDPLSDCEIKSIIEQLQGNIGLKCPHGRPICVKIERKEIDKWFKRIV